MGKDVEFKIPQPFRVTLAGGLDVGLDNVNVDMGLDNVNVDMGLDNINVDMGLDNINADLGLDAINATVDAGLDKINAKIDAGLDNIKLDMGLNNINACLNFGIKEIPSVRVHLPTKYEFGIKVIGLKIFSFFINGKSMLVTEDNPVKVFHKPVKKPSRSLLVPRVKISKSNE